MSTTLYVGNLPFNTTEDDLHELFSKEGTVTKTNLITDKFSGRSRGFGFVEMTDKDAAATAIQKLNDFDMNGRKLVVNEARPRKERTDRPPQGRRSHAY